LPIFLRASSSRRGLWPQTSAAPFMGSRP